MLRDFFLLKHASRIALFLQASNSFIPFNIYDIVQNYVYEKEFIFFLFDLVNSLSNCELSSYNKYANGKENLKLLNTCHMLFLN